MASLNNKINRIIHGDSILELKKIPSDSIDMCYLDPPFFTNRTFESKDENGNINSFDDKWDNDITKYVDFIKNILNECHRVLTKTGSLYLHCDWHASHYLKVEADAIFGRKNFRNEIIWKRHNAHNDTKQGSKILGRVHDVIFFYTKSDNYTWNPMYQPYPEEYVRKYYRYIEPKTGRQYALGDLSGPGGKSKGNPIYEFLGITRYWRFSEENMWKLYHEGRIIQRKKETVPLMKRYLDEMKGLMLQDIWNDIDSVQLTKKESIGYPTQKPTKLLERIIHLSTNEKDTVLDPFCGSGTSLIASKNLRRNFIGIDSNMQACVIAQKRIESQAIFESRMTCTKLV